MKATESTVDELVGRVSRFVKDIVAPYERDPRCGRHGPREDLVAELREHAKAAGVLTPHMPDGGEHLCHRDIARVFRAAGWSPLGPVAINIAAPDEGNMYLLSRVGSDAVKARQLRALQKAEMRSAFFMTEPADESGAGSDPSMMRTTARRDGNHWLINGRKTFITGADGAKIGIVMAMADEGPCMFLVDLPDPAIRIERVLDTLDSSMPGGHAVVAINDLRVSAEQMLGQPGDGFKLAQIRLAPARLTHCMRWLGSALRAQSIATEYACRRHAFGKPLIDHEGVGFMLADNLIDLKQAELMIDWCAGVLDTGALGVRESSLTKAAVSEGLYRVADRCVQILGGTGVSQDTVVEQIFREIRAFRIYDGPTEVHKWSIAKAIKRDHQTSEGSR